MIKTIGAMNVAGGAGKTPMTLWLTAIAAHLYGEKKPVIMIDMDAQSTMTRRVAEHNDITIDGQAHDFYTGTDLSECSQLVTMFKQEFWFIASDVSSEANDRIDTTEQLSQIFSEYEDDMIVIMDLPPRQSRVVENFVTVADGIYCPVSADGDGKGLNGFKRAVAMVETYERNPIIYATGTKFDNRIRNERNIIRQAREFANEKDIFWGVSLPLLRYSNKDPELELLALFHDDGEKFLREVIDD